MCTPKSGESAQLDLARAAICEMELMWGADVAVCTGSLQMLEKATQIKVVISSEISRSDANPNGELAPMYIFSSAPAGDPE